MPEGMPWAYGRGMGQALGRRLDPRVTQFARPPAVDERQMPQGAPSLGLPPGLPAQPPGLSVNFPQRADASAYAPPVQPPMVDPAVRRPSLDPVLIARMRELGIDPMTPTQKLPDPTL